MVKRDDFPFLKNQASIAYFDNAATTLKPQSVIDEVLYYYEHLGANIHRGDYTTSLETSNRFEAVRQKTANFINALSAQEIVFTSGASESINLVAMGFAQHYLKAGDVVLLNEAEHASNILPWFALVDQIGIKIEYIKLDEAGHISLKTVEEALHDRVKLVSIAHVSNVLGYVNDIKAITQKVHDVGALICLDAAQSIGHMRIDVRDLDVDFMAFSAHKMLGPTGVGVLYGKADYLEMTAPITLGGGSNVRFDACGTVVMKAAPARFESGTPNIEGVLGLGAAIDYLNVLPIENIHNWVRPLHTKALNALLEMKHIIVYNPHANTGIITFAVKGIFAQDVAAYLNSLGICVRSGEHCAKLVNGALHMEKSVRISFYFYNTEAEVDRLIAALELITLDKCVDLYL